MLQWNQHWPPGWVVRSLSLSNNQCKVSSSEDLKTQISPGCSLSRITGGPRTRGRYPAWHSSEHTAYPPCRCCPPVPPGAPFLPPPARSLAQTPDSSLSSLDASSFPTSSPHHLPPSSPLLLPPVHLTMPTTLPTATGPLACVGG